MRLQVFLHRCFVPPPFTITATPPADPHGSLLQQRVSTCKRNDASINLYPRHHGQTIAFSTTNFPDSIKQTRLPPSRRASLSCFLIITQTPSPQNFDSLPTPHLARVTLPTPDLDQIPHCPEIGEVFCKIPLYVRARGAIEHIHITRCPQHCACVLFQNGSPLCCSEALTRTRLASDVKALVARTTKTANSRAEAMGSRPSRQHTRVPILHLHLPCLQPHTLPACTKPCPTRTCSRSPRTTSPDGHPSSSAMTMQTS